MADDEVGRLVGGVVSIVAAFLCGCWLTVAGMTQSDEGDLLFIIGLLLATLLGGMYLFWGVVIPFLIKGYL